MKKLILCLALLLTISCTVTACDKDTDGDVETVVETTPETTPETEENTEPVEMSKTELAEYVLKRTVTVNVQDVYGNSSSGSGFYIDDKGTFVTNYHVIDAAKSISVNDYSGTHAVVKVLGFDVVYDLAVLQIDLKDPTPYLTISKTEMRQGEDIYAVGASLGFLEGTFTSGDVSAAKRVLGKIECLQISAQISNGNSGGPLVNSKGEVVGINSYGYASGNDLNLAIKVKELDRVSTDKDWTLSDFMEWYDKTVDRSYVVPDLYDNTTLYYSMITRYEEITGVNCSETVFDLDNWDDAEGYTDGGMGYVYAYDSTNFDKYTEYLKSIGFEYDGSSDSNSGGRTYTYMNYYDGWVVVMYVEDGEMLIAIRSN